MKTKIILLLVICTALVADISAQQCVQCEGGENPGTNASIIGTDNIASGNESFAGGKYSEAQGKRSIAFGENALTISSYSVAMGQDVTAFGGASIVLGRNLMNTSPSIIFGSGFDDDNRLKNTTPNCLIVGFNSTKPTFFVGESTNGANSTGRIGIGNVTDPQAKLHILEDANYDQASVYIQASNIERPAYLWLGTKSYGLQKQNNALAFLTDGDYVFDQGNLKLNNLYQIETIRIQSNARDGLSLFTHYNSGIFIDERGQVGIGNTRPGATLDVTGKIKTYSLQIPGTNPIDSLRDLTNYVLKSKDDYGNVIWAPQSSLDDGDWSTAETGDLYFNAGKVGIGTSSPNSQLQLTEDLTVNDKAHIGNGVSAMHFGQAYSSTFGYGTGYVGYNAERTTDQIWLLRSDGAHNGGNILYGNIFGDMNFICIEPGSNPGSDQEINFQEINQNIKMRLTNDGRLGVGVLDPEEMLEVSGNISATKYFGDGSELSGTGDDLGNHTLQQKLITAGHWINSDTTDNQGIFIDGEGSVGIGTNNFGSGTTTYKLAVAGAIRAEEVQIEHVDTWYDCVFEDHYRLTPLKEVESFVKQNKHLPEVPSEAEVMENGISVGQMNAILLKKVEELTLHLIEQEKKMEEQQKQIDELKKVLEH